MNKTNKLMLLAGLMFFSAQGAFGMGEQEIGMVHALVALGQDLAGIPMIGQNIDMFIGIFGMNIQITQTKLNGANQQLKTALWKNGALLLGSQIVRVAGLHGIDFVNIQCFSRDIRSSTIFTMVEQLLAYDISAVYFVGQSIAALNIYDAWKNRSALQESLATDKKILRKLQSIKNSMADSAEAGDMLLKSPVQAAANN